MEPKPLAPNQGWHGQAHLVYARQAEKTVLVKGFTQAPLKLQKPLYLEGPAVCQTVLVHTAGGMVGGDRLTVQVHLQPDSRGLVTTAAAHKIYGSQAAAGQAPAPLRGAEQRVEIHLASGSCLEWLPQETILFNGANYDQHLRVALPPGAIWCGWEVTRFGRSARGERFDQGQWRSHLEVWQGDRPLWLDRQSLTGGSAALDSPNGLGGQAVVGSFALVGFLPATDLVNELRELWEAAWPGEGGVTRLQTGLLCRYRGPSSEVARRWFVSLWGHLRPFYLGRVAMPSRVWPT
ncbi:MAG TPA: urease accessory protein UreD [Leptolyngbyaceae cyanobacterium M65_K2018_010]|nr:urease accessory protein UreD [Leptolyngbyaceae cyanobacterium M65_K2018_010]